MFTPLVGVPMENSLDLVIVWAMYGSFMRKTFWPMPDPGPSLSPNPSDGLPVRWPKKAHPGALSEEGQARTPWLTRWARATFEQGCLSVLPHLEGACKALSLPGEHLFQAAAFFLIACDLSFFMLLGKPKRMLPRFLMSWHDLGGKLCRLLCWGCHTTLQHGLSTPGNRSGDAPLRAAQPLWQATHFVFAF